MKTTPVYEHHHPLSAYRSTLREILDRGVRRPNRTGDDTLFLPGVCLKFDMNDGFPAFTARKFAFKSMEGELLGFLRAYQSSADFRALGCPVWDGNANTTPSWVNNPNRKGTDDIGRAYGVQWNEWRDWRLATSQSEYEDLLSKGYRIVLQGSQPQGSEGLMMLKELNQVESSLRTLLTNPTDRRNIITGWRPDEHDRMALPACHMTYTWMADTVNNELHLTTHMRSWDMVLAFNIQLSSLFLHIMARLSGFKPATMTLFVDDAHIYMSHIPGLELMLSRKEHPLPTLAMSERIRKAYPDEIPGVFKRLEPEDFWLENYVHEPAIKFQMAA